MSIGEGIGIGIKEARKKAGLTQKELGEKLGVSGAMIAAWENGKRNPKRETISRISEALGVGKWELFNSGDDFYFYSEAALDTVKHIGDFYEKMKTENDENVDMEEYFNIVLQEVLSLGVKAGFVSEMRQLIFMESICLNKDGQSKVLEYLRDLLGLCDYYRKPSENQLDIQDDK